MNATQNWGEAYKEICTLLKTGVSEIKHLDLWYEQIFYTREEEVWPSDSVFLNFAADSINTIGLKVQDMNMLITVYHAFETLSDSYKDSPNQDISLAFIETNRKIHGVLQGKAGNHFSGLNRVSFGNVKGAPEGMIVYQQTYSTIIRDYAPLVEYVDTPITGPELDTNPIPNPTGDNMFKIDMG